MYHESECEDHNTFCKELSSDYDYCTTIDAGINVWMSELCSKSCGYCFNPGSFETDIDKYVIFIYLFLFFFFNFHFHVLNQNKIVEL